MLRGDTALLASAPSHPILMALRMQIACSLDPANKKFERELGRVICEEQAMSNPMMPIHLLSVVDNFRQHVPEVTCFAYQ